MYYYYYYYYYYYFLYGFINDSEVLKLSVFPLGSTETFPNHLQVSLQLRFGVAGSKSLGAQNSYGQKIKNIDALESCGKNLRRKNVIIRFGI